MANVVSSFASRCYEIQRPVEGLVTVVSRGVLRVIEMTFDHAVPWLVRIGMPINRPSTSVTTL